jgi:hypothetical protein
MPWVASAYAKQGQTASFYCTGGGDRFLGISGTTGIKPAVIAHKGAEAGFVARNQIN